MPESADIKCSRIADAFQKNNFFINDVVTIHGIAGYYLSLSINDKSENSPNNDFYAASLIPDTFEGAETGNYAFNEGHRLLSVEGKKLLNGCINWKLDNKSHEIVTSKVATFIQSSVDYFKFFRKTAVYYSVYDMPDSDWIIMDDIISLFGTVMVVPELLEADQSEIDWSRVSADDYAIIFADVGLEYLNDTKSKKVYVAIYRHVKDKEAGNAPKFFAVLQYGIKGLGNKMIMFIHNYNEDTGRCYL